MILTGTVKSMGDSQLEARETPQVSFYLDTSDFDSRPQSILVVIPATRFPCRDGALAILEGDVSPADEFFPLILLSPKVLSCDGVKVQP